VRALPALTRRERAAATAARLQLHPPRPRAAKALPVAPASKEGPPSPPTLPPFAWVDEEDEDFSSYETSGNGFRYQGYVGIASELVVVMDIGSFAPEGAILVVNDTRLGMPRTPAPLLSCLRQQRGAIVDAIHLIYRYGIFSNCQTELRFPVRTL
jgi:hypothetical protein